MFNFFKRNKTEPEKKEVAPRPSPWSTHEVSFLSRNALSTAIAAAWSRLAETNMKIVGKQLTKPDGSTFDSDDGALPMFKGGTAADNETVAYWYMKNTFIGYNQAAIFAQHWLVRKACWLPGGDAVRHWFDIKTEDGDELGRHHLALYRKYDRIYNLRENLIEFVGLGRVFGVRIAFFDMEFESEDKREAYYRAPFNEDGLTTGRYKGIVQIDPLWCAPELTSEGMDRPDGRFFYEPTYWMIQGRRYHRSHLIIFRNGHVPDFLKPAYRFGGIPLPQLLYERVFAAERTANEAPQLAMSKRLTVMYTDLANAFSDVAAFQEILSHWTDYQNNFGVKIADLEGDKIEMHDTSLADFDAILMTQYQLVAAIAGVPATKLFGTSPKGFGGEGHYEEASYHEHLESIQSNDMSKLVDRHHLIVRKQFMRDSPVTLVDWRPVDSPSTKEWAEINASKAATAKSLYDTGAIDAKDIRDMLAKDPTSDFQGIEPLEREDLDDGQTQVSTQPQPSQVGATIPGAATQGVAPQVANTGRVAIPSGTIAPSR